MLYPRHSVAPEMVKCEVGLKESPASDECYEIWNRQDADQLGQDPPT